MEDTFAVVASVCLVVILTSYAYFRRYSLVRPPIGVMDTGDIVVILLAVLVTPLVYVALPAWASIAVSVPAGLGIIYVTLQPVTQGRRLLTPLLPVTLVVLDIVVATRYGTNRRLFLALNNVIILVMIVGVSNLWAQSGMKVRHVALLTATLTLYDFVATSRLPVMADVQQRIVGVPLAPLIGWATNDSYLSLGLGDLLVAATFVLTVRRAYGQREGVVALILAWAGICTSLALVALQIVHRLIPAMVVIGPLLLAQYALLRWRHGAERTTAQYVRADPPRRAPSTRLVGAAGEPARLATSFERR